MNLVQLQSQIKSKSLSNLYLFTGEDFGLINAYIDRIHESYGGKLIRSEKLLDVWGGLTQRSIFGTKGNNVYVVRDDGDVKKQEKLWGKLYTSISNGILILVYTDLSKNTKMYKTLSEYVVEFNHMTTPQLVNHIMKQFGDNSIITREHAEYLANTCDRDLCRIDNEIAKIKLLDLKDDCDIYHMIDDLVYSVAEFEVFPFISRLFSKDYKYVLEDLKIIEDPTSGINRIGLLTLLYNKFYEASKVMGLPWDKDIESRTGVSYFHAKPIWTNCKFKHESCLTAMRIIQDTESGIKQGRYSEIQSVSACIVSILTLK